MKIDLTLLSILAVLSIIIAHLFNLNQNYQLLGLAGLTVLIASCPCFSGYSQQSTQLTQSTESTSQVKDQFGELGNSLEINPDFQSPGNQNLQKITKNSYPMLDYQHRNKNDCTQDGSCIQGRSLEAKLSLGSNPLKYDLEEPQPDPYYNPVLEIKAPLVQAFPSQTSEEKVKVEIDKLCPHGKACNPHLENQKKGNLVENFELTGKPLSNDDTLNVIDVNAPFYKDPMTNQGHDSSKNLCHHCQLGKCFNGICGTHLSGCHFQ